jgi:hypothetical protein
MKKFFALLLFSAPVFSTVWAPNDISILYPLDLAPSTKDKIPTPLLERVSPLAMGFGAPTDLPKYLKMVGVRIDPCFEFTSIEARGNTPDCRPQVRMVWQIVHTNDQKKLTTVDAAVHTFYELSQDEFGKLKQDLLALKLSNEKMNISTEGVPLGLHPAFNSKVSRKVFAKKLSSLWSKFCTHENLKRITFMKLLTPNIWWNFGGLDQVQGDWGMIQIPRYEKSDVTTQDFFNDDFQHAYGMKGTIKPSLLMFGAIPDELEIFTKGYGIFPETDVGKELVKKAQLTIHRINNTRIHNASSIDCVHCHIADAVQLWMDKEKKFNDITQEAPVERLQNLPHNKSLRQFGYFNEDPSIGTRMIMETNAVIEEFNRKN